MIITAGRLKEQPCRSEPVDGILGAHTLMKAKALEAAAGRFVAAGDRTRARAAFTAAVQVCTSLGAAAGLSRLQAAFRPGHRPHPRPHGGFWLHPHKALPHPDETTTSQRQHVSAASRLPLEGHKPPNRPW